MASPDPDFWQEAAKWLWGLLLIPLGVLYKKADNAVQKEEMDKCLRHIEKLYENAEGDRKLTRDLHDSAMREIRDNQTNLINILGRRNG